MHLLLVFSLVAIMDADVGVREELGGKRGLSEGRVDVFALLRIWGFLYVVKIMVKGWNMGSWCTQTCISGVKVALPCLGDMSCLRVTCPVL
jgi:hypothetical protein